MSVTVETIFEERLVEHIKWADELVGELDSTTNISVRQELEAWRDKTNDVLSLANKRKRQRGGLNCQRP